ncbi:hypothetical protein COCON_G00058120 [Conger conger]|uniref:Uncharacterized protein n=1 Tax=Conger conger TaxID=82655 RepID=A0A9Q1DQX9_CONCO|nr:hypothetical protein COCON_G00058120 [Conger conger]
MKDLSADLLDAVDLDAPSDTLTLSVLGPPAHGTLIRGAHGLQTGRYADTGPAPPRQSPAVQSFTLRELRRGMKIIYMHDDTETLKDAFTMQLTDGGHTVQGTAHVRILPVNDEKPRLLKNAGLEVDAMDRRVISSVVLEAEDLDSPADALFYVLRAGPKFGQLQLKTGSGWRVLGPGQNFTQEDVEMNRVWYLHTTLQGVKGHDSFRFTLSDAENESPSQAFFISLRTAQKGDIVLITKPVTLTEGERVVLTTDVLLATDGGGSAAELVYAVSVPPAHGHLHAVQRPGVALGAFSQLDVAAHRVAYTHDNGRGSPHDSVSFVVSNGVTSRSGTLRFTVEHGDRIPPTLSGNAGLRLPEGATASITRDNLELTDPDTAAGNLTYALVQRPQHGRLLLRGAPLTRPKFTQEDVNNLDLAYWHQGGPAQIDRFSFLASDGTNRGSSCTASSRRSRWPSP